MLYYIDKSGDELKKEVDKINQQIKDNLKSVEVKITTQENQVKTLEGKVTKQESAVTELKTKIGKMVRFLISFISNLCIRQTS